MQRSEIDIAMHALRYDFVNKLLYLLHYWMHGVTWLNSRWWLQRHRYHKYVIEISKRLVGVLPVRSVQPNGKTWNCIQQYTMETGRPVQGSFSREFSSFVIIAELW